MKARMLALILLGASASHGATNAVPNTFEIYPLGTSDRAAIQTIVQALVGADGTVTHDAGHNRLLVVATPEQHKQIAAIMTKTAVSPKNVSIEVNFAGAEDSFSKGASVGGQVAVERVDDVTKVRWKIRPQVTDNSVQTTDNTKQQLMVSSGREARLRVGETVPYETWLVDYGITQGFIQRQIGWRDVGSFLVVEPTVIGEGPMIRIRITPELSGMVNGSQQATRYSSVSTEVTVRDGETVTIGGAAKDSEFYSRFLIGGYRSGGSRRVNISLTPRILDVGPARVPAGPPPKGAQIPQTIRVWGEERTILPNRP